MSRHRDQFDVSIRLTSPVKDADYLAAAFAGDMATDAVEKWTADVHTAITAARATAVETKQLDDSARQRKRRELEAQLAEIQKRLAAMDAGDAHHNVT